MPFDSFADLHCHAFLRPFERLPLEIVEKVATDLSMSPNPCMEASVWHQKLQAVNPITKLENELGFVRFSESDFFSASINGNYAATRYVFTSLYAIESGFFGLGSGTWWNDFIHENHLEAFLAGILGPVISVYAGQKIKYIDSPDYNYFTDLCNQLYFVCNPAGFTANLNDCNSFKDLDGISYKVLSPNNFETGQSTTIKVVISIEGANCFWGHIPDPRDSTKTWIGRHFEQLLNPADIANYVPVHPGNTVTPDKIENAHTEIIELIPYAVCDQVMVNVKQITNAASQLSTPGVQVPRPFYITIGHHFYNGIAGHPQSLQPLSDKNLVNQTFGMDTDITNLGWMIINELLKNNIIVDIKHMSRKARNSFYNFHKYYYQNIPIICSHGAVYGDSLPGLVGALPPDNNNGFYKHDINLFDEDITTIILSRGIIGVEMDKRVNGVQDEITKAENDDMLFANIQYIVAIAAKIATTAGLPANASVWNYAAIGTDFDGIINPVDNFNTYSDMDALYNYLVTHVDAWKNTNPPLPPADLAMPTEKIVKKIMFDNTVDFLHFNYQ